MLKDRISGILLHPTSLPSRGGIGDLGPAAYEFVDWLASARQGAWQVLPLGPVGYGNSPYSSTSAFAGNVLMISLERLAERGLIPMERVHALEGGNGNVDYYRVRETKLPLLNEAARTFLRRSQGEERRRFDGFCEENSWWLDDFVLFDELRRKFGERSWNEWPTELAHRDAGALAKVRDESAEALEADKFLQFAFFEQWSALHAYCRVKGIRIIGDVAIFVSYDSADVWTHPDIFWLRGDRSPEFVAGVPPDAFSAEGQRWGNPLYRWDVLKARGYDWWVDRVRWSLKTCDLLRLDHFRGFQQYWEIPASEPNAVHGRWVDGPGEDLFNTLRERLGDLPFIAEDLGIITPDVAALRERMRVPGMRVLQFAFGDPGAHIYLPHRYEAMTVVYTGTHDNDTTAGWWRNVNDYERKAVKAYFGEQHDEGVHWAMIRAAQRSVAQLSIVPFQDPLGLGSEARMNTPSLPDGNWSWRMQHGMLRADVADKLAALAEVSDRTPSQFGSEQSYREMAQHFFA
jgi:4-alpha-glucanotransferase